MTITNQRTGYNSYIFLFLILLIGLMVRLFTYPQVFEQGRIVFLEADPYYHMWRVISYIDMFPKTFFFDSFINYPYGVVVGWPPLFDQTIALISIILGLGKPSAYLVESVGAFVPVLLGVLSIIVIYFLAKEIFNERIALYSSLIFAVLPAHAQISFLGFTDHHVAEVLLSALSYLFFIRALKTNKHSTAAISGILIGLSFLTWVGAPIFIGIILTYITIQFILDNKSKVESDHLLKIGTISFSIAFFTIILFYLWTPWQKEIQGGTLSYFQPIYVFISLIIVLISGMTSKIMKDQKWFFYPSIIIVLFASFFYILAYTLPSFYDNLLNGIEYLLRDAPVLKQIIEAQPLFYTFEGTFLGWQFFSNPVWYSFAFGFYFAIIGFFLLLYYHRTRIDKGTLFLVIWTLIVLALALWQRRFTYSLAVNVAILSGFLIDKIRSFSLKPYYIIVILILVIPNSVLAYNMAQSPPRPSDDWYDSLIWLRENTPDPGKPPQYGIMTWWDYGNWILYISKRPVVANNFQIGGDEAARFFVAPDETIGNTIMDKRKARYVIVDRRMGLNKFKQGDELVLKGTFMTVLSFADKNPAMYLDKYNLPNDNYFQTMYARMHVFDGNGLKNYRMIYESKETHYDLFDKPTKNIKIFEYVMGAKIEGKVTSKRTASISGQIITNQGRIFDYSEEAKVDENGYFEFIVPYSGDSHYETRLLKGYYIRYDNSNISINISENDILNGNIIKVNL